ncbi:MAG: BON domain-containing protein [Pirellulaceae bacterium]|jgi:hypothetical protein|nr:BON domain-containing protein [Pirellulaceae bacterium]
MLIEDIDLATSAESLASIKPTGLWGIAKPILLCVVVSSFTASAAQAQLFGARSVGSPISSPFSQGGGLNSNAAGSAVGILSGNERFVRGNRSRRDFVGSDRSEQSGFVGAGQAIGVGRVRSATEGLRIETADTQRINRPIPAQSSKGIYYPRLEIAFDVEPSTIVSPAELSADERLLKRVVNVAGDTVQVTLAGRTAILHGTVNSARDAELAAQLLSFEPGIDRVQNELSIAK